MRHRKRTVVLVLLATLAAAVPSALAQPPAGSSDEARRQRALALFDEGKRLEALPLLEAIAPATPTNSDVLVALAASLIDHAATLTDPDAAAAERFRARDILQRAFELGNPSPLAENLRQLLAELPANGAITYSDNPAVGQIMRDGEAAFSRREFDAALTAYARALELEPTNYPAVLFTAHAYDRKNEVARATDWYERAIRLDPNVETAYRYYADMLANRGEMARARDLLIQAAVAEPYNRMVWREIRAWALINHTAFTLVYAPIPLTNDEATDSGPSADVSVAWRAYHAVKAAWQTGGRFRTAFPQERVYRHSLQEESQALTAAARVLEQLNSDPKTARLVAVDAVAGLLVTLFEAGLIEPYVLFSLGDDGIAKDYIPYRTRSRDKLAAYLDKFVLPRVPR